MPMPGLLERLGMDGPPRVSVAAGDAHMVPIAPIFQPLLDDPGADSDLRVQPEVLASITAEGSRRPMCPDASSQHAQSSIQPPHRVTPTASIG